MISPPRNIPADENDWSWRSDAYAWWVVFVLALSLVLSLIDRLILALMIAPIKADFGLSDTQIGLLHGLAFTLLFMIMGLPMGMLADRWSRRGLAMLSVAGWSVMTAACGFANGFNQLFVARMGVGVGEAGLSPAAISLISDYFPKTKRAKPLAFLSIGTVAGGGFALIFGGVVMHMLGEAEAIALPLIGTVRSWQAIFILLGIFGVVFSMIFLTIREPVRREQAEPGNQNLHSTFRFLQGRRAYLTAHFVGVSCSVLVAVGFHLWIPSMLMRRFGWDASDAGLAYGSCLAAGGVAGVVLGGWLAERLIAQGRRDAHLLVAIVAAATALPSLVLAPLLSAPEFVIGGLFFGIMGLSIVPALAPASLQSICPNEVRGQTFAVYLFVVSLIGYVGGPLIIAIMTDSILGDENALHLSLSIVAAIFIPISAGCLALARRRYAGAMLI